VREEEFDFRMLSYSIDEVYPTSDFFLGYPHDGYINFLKFLHPLGRMTCGKRGSCTPQTFWIMMVAVLSVTLTRGKKESRSHEANHPRAEAARRRGEAGAGTAQRADPRGLPVPERR
jgi:hypothetical protein